MARTPIPINHAIIFTNLHLGAVTRRHYERSVLFDEGVVDVGGYDDGAAGVADGVLVGAARVEGGAGEGGLRLIQPLSNPLLLLAPLQVGSRALVELVIGAETELKGITGCL